MITDSHYWPDIDPEFSNERALITVLLDASASMSSPLTTNLSSNGKRLKTRFDELNAGLSLLVSPANSSVESIHNAVNFDGTAEFAIGQFPTKVKGHYVEWCKFPDARTTSGPFVFGKDVTRAPKLVAPTGHTPLGEALIETLDAIEKRRLEIREKERRTTLRPILFLITDGEPTTKTHKKAIERIRQAEANKRLLFFAIGTHDANTEILMQLAPEAWYDLKNKPIVDLIQFLSTSSEKIASTDPNVDSLEFYRHIRDSFENMGSIVYPPSAREVIENNDLDGV